MQAALIAAVKESNKIKDYEKTKISTDNPHLAEYLDTHGKYKLTIRERDLYRCLGANLGTANVLDVGCGSLMTTTNLLWNMSNVSLATIDKSVVPTDQIAKLKKNISEWKHISANIFSVDLVDLPKNKYDIVVIDIEPHGNEIDVYEKIKPFMKPIHICILKHVGSISMFGSVLADRFLDKYVQSKNVIDYFAQYDIAIFAGMRDIFVVMSLDEVALDKQAQDLATGKVAVWIPHEPSYTQRVH